MSEGKKSHPWRICPVGTHFVKSHYKKTESGTLARWDSHCRKNSRSKDLLNFDEIQEISSNFEHFNFSKPKTYDFGVDNGNAYDLLIGGWVKFWTDLLGDQTNITPDFVKVLIMSESSFRTSVFINTKNNSGRAIGLMQLTEATIKLLDIHQTEVSDFFFALSSKDLENPAANICAGVRWLFRKRDIAKSALKHEPSALELAEEYKGIRGDKSIGAITQRNFFLKKLKEYNEAE